jgi:hypothetical protein
LIARYSTDVEIVYSRPSARGRAVLVTWFLCELGEQGVNENTTITFSG